jgi:hypothetical protein
MRHDAVTGQIARERPDINKLGPHPVNIPVSKQHHDTSGVPRRQRRAEARSRR